MIRAKALTAGAASGTNDSNFWQSSAEQAVRALLHAAALGSRSSADLYRWSLSAAQAREAVMILATHPAAALSWHQGLEAIVGADQKQRDSVWAMVAIAFASLADPKVLDAVSPAPGEQFDPQTFLRQRGTVFLVGTSTGASATAGLVGAFVEDVAEAARRMAAASPGARIDPPLSMILDKAANYPLPSLTSLMSEGGGTGIATMVVLQSLAQARAVWGEHQASAIWDAASVKLILGGGSNARDLQDLSKLIGQRDERKYTESIGADGRRSRSSSLHETPVMDTSRLRMLPFGTAVLMLRAARPIVLSMKSWTQRPDAAELQLSRRRLEGVIERASSPAHPLLVPSATSMTTRRDPFEVKFTDVSGPTHWPSLLPDDARQAWADLRDWVEHLVDRFGLETRAVPPCWYRHNTLVEALAALRDHERICFGPMLPRTPRSTGFALCARSSTNWRRLARGPSARSTSTAPTPCALG